MVRGFYPPYTLGGPTTKKHFFLCVSSLISCLVKIKFDILNINVCNCFQCFNQHTYVRVHIVALTTIVIIIKPKDLFRAESYIRVWHYKYKGRTTKKLDFLVNISPKLWPPPPQPIKGTKIKWIAFFLLEPILRLEVAIQNWKLFYHRDFGGRSLIYNYCIKSKRNRVDQRSVYSTHLSAKNYKMYKP